MICKRISVRNFRNIRQADVTFDDGVNILWGPNAQGKTNLLEAIFFASVGRSFRGAKEAEMIAFDASDAAVSVDFADSRRTQNLSLRLFRNRKRVVEQNAVRLEKMSDMIGQYRTVLFCPEHLAIVKEGPALRRNFLDVAISQLRPVYLHALQRYNHILKERNTLIKKAEEDRATFDGTIEFWSAQLAHEAAAIAGWRARYLGALTPYVTEAFGEMTDGREIPGLTYIGSAGKGDDPEAYLDPEATEKKYLSLLTGHLEREIGAGATLFGTHRDDVELTLNGRSARTYASQGQQRSLALALKIAEGEICRQESGEYPVFLFDDVFSELDGSRRAYLCEKIGGKQMILTSCEPDLIGQAKKIRVCEGTFCQERETGEEEKEES